MFAPARPLQHHSFSVSQPYHSRQIVKHHNKLDERTLRFLLDRLQRKLYARRGKKTTLVVHGGIISVMTLKARDTTTDVDFIARTLPEEISNAKGISSPGIMSFFKGMFGAGKSTDVRALIKECVSETADDFNAKNGRKSGYHLEEDWMNSDADVAIPWTLTPENYRSETLVHAAIEKLKEDDDVIYDSQGLRLVAIPSAWVLALKVQRYTYADEDDIVYLSQEDGACAQYDEETFARMVEERLRTDCPQMEYEKFPERAMQEWRMRVRDCVRKAKFLMSVPRNMLEEN